MPKLAAAGKGIKHQLNGYLKGPSVTPVAAPSNGSHLALAQRAVGKGIRHSFSCGPQPPQQHQQPQPPQQQQPSTKETIKQEPVAAAAAGLDATTPQFTFQDPHQLGMDIQNSLSELSNNFKNSLKDVPAPVATAEEDEAASRGFGMLSRNSSLVDLAMLHPVEPTPVSELQHTYDPVLMSFVDFPHNDLDPPEPDL